MPPDSVSPSEKWPTAWPSLVSSAQSRRGNTPNPGRAQQTVQTEPGPAPRLHLSPSLEWTNPKPPWLAPKEPACQWSQSKLGKGTSAAPCKTSAGSLASQKIPFLLLPVLRAFGEQLREEHSTLAGGRETWAAVLADALTNSDLQRATQPLWASASPSIRCIKRYPFSAWVCCLAEK